MFIRSFLSNLIKIAIGVTTRKNIIPIITGEIILPKKLPNLNQILFKGLNNFEFKNPKKRKINERIIDQTRISP